MLNAISSKIAKVAKVWVCQVWRDYGRGPVAKKVMMWRTHRSGHFEVGPGGQGLGPS